MCKPLLMDALKTSRLSIIVYFQIQFYIPCLHGCYLQTYECYWNSLYATISLEPYQLQFY